MSKLKNSFNQKMNINSSKDFDAVFFKKLEEEQARPKVFSHWVTWLVSGCATASVLFIAVTNYNVPARPSLNHKEYVESVLQAQSTFNEEISRDEIDLTVIPSDEI